MSRQRSVRWALVAMLALIMNVLTAGDWVQTALAYNCGDPQGGAHCYAIYQWEGGTTGGRAEILVTHTSDTTTYVPGDYNFVYNGEWLLDQTNSSSCPSLPCWVESGYLASVDPSHSGVWYVWADKRPNGTFYKHWIASVPSGDFGQYALISFWYNPGASYSVSIISPNESFAGYSTPNTMQADAIEIGEELTGASGGYAPTTYWQGNEFREGSTWYFQFRPNPMLTDYEHFSNPPHGGWVTLPSNSSYGGDFWASCCS